MKILILGGTGAVGSGITQELRKEGHQVDITGRRQGIRVDLASTAGFSQLRTLAPEYGLIINASGVEDPDLLTAVSPVPFVEVSATASYLAQLADQATKGHSVLLGAGLIPGLSTLMIHELPHEPGDDLDLAVILGTGEHHGPAAVQWTASLAGQEIYAPPEGGKIRNFTETRTLFSPTGPRTYLRTDFPDHLLTGDQLAVNVRSYLAVGDRLTTFALRMVGKIPSLSSLMQRVPAMGSDRWSLTLHNRRNGMQLHTSGHGQSRATAWFTAAAALALREHNPGTVVTTGSLMRLADLTDQLQRLQAPA
ncbi:hypothetical protein [Glutamicibacter sp. NPDC087344]|uniref:hypothetical protein n=1 Tax=Glutamicibacter sp. NPDC087344 TaxID=3363994 RepID=UPI00381E7BFB